MFSQLRTQPYHYKDPQFLDINLPKIVGYFSINGQRDFLPDVSQLKFVSNICEGPANFNLNDNFEEYVPRSSNIEHEKLAMLLRFLVNEKNEGHRSLQLYSKTLEKAKFVTNRRLLNCVASTPYMNMGPWSIIVSLFNGTIYMCKKEDSRGNESRNTKFASYGYKFEQFIVSDTPHAEPNLNKPCDANEQFNLVLEKKINDHEIVYTAEVDGMRTDYLPNLKEPPNDVKHILNYLKDKQFIELKTTMKIQNKNHRNSLRKFKMRNWWCQSFLAGVDDILCGFRNKDGIVESVQHFKVSELPGICKGYWKPNICMNFLDAFLSYVKSCLSDSLVEKYGNRSIDNLGEADIITLHFEWKPGQPIRVTDNYDRVADNIIPDWFKESYRSSGSKQK